MPVPQSWRSFDWEGRLVNEAVDAQLQARGAEVTRAARQFHAEGTCNYAEDRPLQPTAAGFYPNRHQLEIVC
jgi:FMN reductase